ncbi:unnamed protein product [Coffea canephora]|uniref:PUM-HD domain-containing protein n=1 Tax=Coffea canephora TaxID=49390 RepID=A0A068TNJ9_COFCA|nr:unnamed protein product [Coffea canephora]
MGRKPFRKRAGYDGNHSSQGFGGQMNRTGTFSKPLQHDEASVPHASFVRKQVDPETSKYFTEIANVIEGSEIDLEERAVICGNALEEARGKEVQLATDYIISHTLQTLLEGCSVEHLCGFLRNCQSNFSLIAMDRSGSHVVETALKALAMHLQDTDNQSLIEDTLTTISRMIVVNPVDIMCNCYGSHVIRSLLCLCGGVPLDPSGFHSTKSSTVLAERLNSRVSPQSNNDLKNLQQRFPELLEFLVSEMLSCARKDMAVLRVNQYGSLTSLKLLARQEQLLLDIVPVILGCSSENANKGNLIENTVVQKLLPLMEKTAFSHLMEVILEVAPDSLYEELFVKVFRNSLFPLSSQQCGNFVVQALISHARTKDQMDLIWVDLGTKLKDLFEMGRSGVVASLVAACERLHSHENKCSQALAAAVCAMDESPRCIVPRILFLDKYFSSEDKSNCYWPDGVKMHVVGSLILQTIFRLPCEFIQSYITSITSLEDSQVLEASKDACGSRVIEAFLSSNASSKQKRKLVIKLCGHFGELSVHSLGSFTVDKCFDASSASLRETIVSELVPVQKDLLKTKQGPYLLRKLDVEGFAKRPDQWKLRQASKQSVLKEFYDAFGPPETKSSKNKSFVADANRKSQPDRMQEIRKEIDNSLVNVAPHFGNQFLAHQTSKKAKNSGRKRPRERTSRARDARGGGDLGNKKKKKHNRNG